MAVSSYDNLKSSLERTWTDSCSSSTCWHIKSSVSWSVKPAQRQIRPTRPNPNPKNTKESASHHFGWFYDDFIIKFMFSNEFCFQGKVTHRFWMEWQGKQDMLKLTPRQHMSYVQSSCIVCSLFSSIQDLKLRCQIAIIYI